MELLRPGSDLNEFRVDIVGTAAHAEDSSQAEVDELAVYPQDLQLVFREGTIPQHPVVWYYRLDEQSTWSILEVPSERTLGGGDHLAPPVPAGSVLQSGLYRADLYAHGIITSVFSEPYDSDARLTRKVSRELGMSVVVPTSWQEWSYGATEWHVGPDESTGITLRRMEGMQPDDIHPFLVEHLDQWAATVTDEPIVKEPDHWLFGLTDALMTQSPDRTIWQEAALAPYGSHWGCGGTLFLMRVSSNSRSPSASELYNSIVLERPGVMLPDHGEVVEAGGLSVDVPAGWDAALRAEGGTGDLLMMRDCASNANVLVSAEEWSKSVNDYVTTGLSSYPEQFPDFTLELDTPASISGAQDDGRLIIFTWQPEHLTEPVRQWQVFGARGGTMLVTTLTTYATESDDQHWVVDLITSSMEMSDP